MSKTVALGLVTTLSIISAGVQTAEAASKGGQIVVANRSSGGISVIDATTNQILQEVPLPFNPGAGDMPPEPMYISHISSKGEVAVGDRANNRVVFFDQKTYQVTGTVATGSGVFHQWANLGGNQLWVNNDIDNTVTIINPLNKTVTTTLDVAGVFSGDDNPHDVILSPDGASAFVSFQNVTTTNDGVAKFSTDDFSVLDTIEVGLDPHLSVTAANNFLYVPAQDSNVVQVFDRDTLDLVTEIDVPGAHGAGMSPDGQTFYTTNLPGGGDNGLFAIDTTTNMLVGDTDGVNTFTPVPHNVAVTGDGKKLFVSHSGGSSSTVSVYTLDDPSLPVFQESITVDGFNPFGILFIASVPEPSSWVGLMAVSASFGVSTLLRRKSQ